ncbi:MAG: NYN domain-containing protein [Pseudomonadota bacterium]|nr:NYN domain-containing protein [Pseudomonadota bacterium]
MNAGNGHKVMLLVDADNVSADVMEQAVRGVIAEHGHLHVRRAYCTAEVALKHQQLFKRLSMRPMVNLAAGKNSTDIALAVDAMDLVMAERPQLVYLVSSDSDFAPLVNRLREKGCRVCGIGQQGKTGEETRAAYDHFIDLKHKGAGTAAAPADAPPARPARKAAAKKTGARRGDAAAPASEVDTVRAADAVPAARAPARKSAARKTATTRGARTAAAAEAPAPSAAAQAVLDAAPALIGGAELALNDVVQALRAAKLLGKHASSLKFFERLQGEFVLLQHPDRVRWSGAGPT